MKNIITPIVATVLACTIAHCNDGCKPAISPADAYAMELSACASKRDAKVIQCAEEAGSRVESQLCRANAEHDYRDCKSAVDKEYGL